jgi:hypothetical protein
VEVRYTTTMDDLIDAMVHVRRTMPFLRRMNQLIVGMIIVGGGLWTLILFAESPTAALFVGLLTIVFVAAYPQFHRVTERRHVGKQINAMGAHGLIGRITLVLTDESLTEQTETVRSEVRWQDMNRVEVVGDITYIFLTGMSMAIIPRHGFERDEDYMAVRDFAIAKLGKSG